MLDIPALSPFPTTFSHLSKTEIIKRAALDLSSTNAFNFDKPKISLFGKELTCDNILCWSNLKESADDNLKVAEIAIYSLIEYKILWLPAFPPFSTIFLKGFFPMIVKNLELLAKRLINSLQTTKFSTYLN